MSNREIPLFIIDTLRNHKRGECDFLVCTDKDCGFIAKVDYIDEEKEEVGDDYRIGFPRRGCSLRIKIHQMIGQHPDTGRIRTLLKKGMEYFLKAVTCEVHVNNPSREECADFLNTLVRMNKQYVDDAGSDYHARQATIHTIMMLEATRKLLLEKLEGIGIENGGDNDPLKGIDFKE